MGEVGPPRPLAENDHLESFDCGREALNHWFRRHAWRNQRDGLSRTTVLVDGDNGAIAAYSALCTAEVAREFLPKAEQRNRPDPIPAMLLGQLAVDHRYQGRQYARSLIVLSFRTVVRLSMETGCYCLLTAPLDEEVRAFYRHFDFRDLPFDKGRRMFVRIAELARNGFAPN
jgi:hypothetical protein